MTLFFAAVDEFCDFVSQSFILHEPSVREGGVDSGDDGWGEGSRMYRWLCWSMRYGGGFEEVGGSLDKVGFP